MAQADARKMRGISGDYKRTCEVTECSTVHYGNGYCKKHYNRMKTRGTTDPFYEKNPVKRFFEKAVKGKKESDCWGWSGYINPKGYASFNDGTRIPTRAHRWSYLHHHGEIADGLYVCHTCDNPSCSNPLHLFLGTQKDNIADMIAKKRGHWQ